MRDQPTDHVPLGTQFLELNIAVQQSRLEDGIDIDELSPHGPPLGALAGVDKSQPRGAPFFDGVYLAGLDRLDQACDVRGGKGRDPREERAAVAERVSQVVKKRGLLDSPGCQEILFEIVGHCSSRSLILSA